MTHSKQSRPLALSLTVLGVISRLLPHPPNFAPVGAASLFAGARLPLWQAYLVPLLVMAVTDPILNTLNGLPAFTDSALFIYPSFLISVWIGRRLVNTESVAKLGAACLLSSLQFFALSNFAAFLRLYPHSWSGLTACYVAAVPFFERTLLGDLFYAAVLFGLYAALTRWVATGERVTAAV